MSRLNEAQQKVVEDNMGLVGKVIRDKVHGLGMSTVYSYEDLFQIGCIGLCKAAATDKGGTFSTYAYRLIWNEICDALIKSTRMGNHEVSLEDTAFELRNGISEETGIITGELGELLSRVEERAPSAVIRKGVVALKLSAEGYKSPELGRLFHAKPAAVRMWMTKARRFLRDQPELMVG